MTPVRAAAFLAAAFCCVLSRPAASEAPLFSVYPSYGAKFDIGSGKFSLVTNMVIYNISGQAYTDVAFKQTYPDGVGVKETYQREIGTEATGEQSSTRRVEGNAFLATMPTFKNRMYAVIPNELVLARRLDEITFPGVEISYTNGDGQRQSARMPDNTYNLFIYSNVVGGLERFLNKYNNITFNFAKATPDRKEWEFAPVAASARGRFPTGIIGTFPGENQYSGHFRIRSGPPGDTIQILVAYKRAEKNERVVERDALLKSLREYLRWCGEFDFSPESLQVHRGEWKKYGDAWSVEGRWLDTIKNRLGEGPLKAKVFWGSREDVEYYVLALAHGRGLGTDSANPNPEKEGMLAAEIDQLLDTFKSSIVPLSYERRR
ncbi:MAG: hypothetical protein HYS34_11280 [Acidobacteria bacterium]|nr:hypothetical protein [Acidobacteriota bacterium]